MTPRATHGGMRRLLLLLALASTASGCSLGPFPRFLRAWQRSISISTIDDRRNVLRAAFEQLDHEQNDEALANAEALMQAGYPELEDYVLYVAGETYARLNAAGAARKALSKLVSEYPDSILAPRAALTLGTLLQVDGKDLAARPYFEKAKASGDRATRVGALVGLGKVAARVGDYEGAYRNFQSARELGKGVGAALVAKREVVALRKQAPWIVPTGGAAIDEVKLLLAEGDAATAEQVARRAAHEPGTEGAVLHEWLGKALLAQGRTEEAYVAFWEVVEQFPEAPAARESLYRIATTLWNRDRDEAAERAYRSFLDRYPDDQRVPDVLYALGRIDQGRGKGEDAVPSYRSLIGRYPKAAAAKDARWRIGWIRYRQQDWWEAAKQFADLADTSRERDRDAANYWRARSHQRGGRVERARELLRAVSSSNDSGYYAMLAQNRLTGGDDDSLLAHLRGASTAVVAPAEESIPDGNPSGMSTFHLSRWRELRAAELRELAREELDAVADTAPKDADSQRFLLRAYRATDGHTKAIKLAGTDTVKQGLSARERMEVLYPLAFWDSVKREAETNHLDPLLLLAVMRQESAFDPEARSAADARGLLQLLPATASRISARTDGRDVTPQLLFTPAINVKLGAAYFKSLLDRFDGNVIKAIAAYNGGETSVEKWQSRSGRMPIDEFVEEISYRETRDYVKRVIHNYEAYRRLYAS